MEMQSKQAFDKDFGLGLFLEFGEEYHAIYHPGGNMGFRTMMYYIPTSKQGIVIMSNSDNAWYLFPEIIRGASEKYNWPSFKTTIRADYDSIEIAIKNYEKDLKADVLKGKIRHLIRNDSTRKNVYDQLSDFGAMNYQIWRMNEAIELFTLCNEIFADSIDTYINLGMAFRRNEQYQNALDVFQRGIRMNPNEEFLKAKIKEMKTILE